MKEIDIYSGWIIAWVDGLWRHCCVASGYVALAGHRKPNEHICIAPVAKLDSVLDHLSKVEEPKIAIDLSASLYLLVGPVVEDKDVLDRIAVVRFGVSAQTGASFYLADATPGDWLYSQLELNWNHATPVSDQMQAVPAALAGVSKFKLPQTPSRWARTARSQVHS